MTKHERKILIGGVLCLLTVALYMPVGRFDFVNWDDDQYIVENRHVNSGLSWQNTRWALTTGHLANWHPLTWLSHQLDCQMFGASRPGWHHAENVVWHVINTWLVLALIARLTQSNEVAAIVAALFAFHPLHVESVAWVSERKDLLSTFFGLLAMWAYLGYADHPCGRRMGWVTLGIVASLLCKPMFVTLPVLLLLLDFWPLRRNSEVPWKSLWLEKWPLWLASAVFSVVAIVAQRAGGALQSFGTHPFDLRLANAARSYVVYLAKTVWPSNLCCLYPWPLKADAPWSARWPFLATGLGCAAALAAVSWLAWRQRSRQPALFVGWFWFLVTLLPVIGIVQVGWQTHADRYMYWPMVGLLLGVFYTLNAWFTERWHARQGIFLLGALCLAAMLNPARRQILTWQDTETLFSQALDLHVDNPIAYFNRGLHYHGRGVSHSSATHMKSAEADYRAALRFEPNHVRAMNNLATIIRGRDPVEAEKLLRHAVEIDPEYTDAFLNLSNILLESKQWSSALEVSRRAVEIKPHHPGALSALGRSLYAVGNKAAAADRLRASVAIDPDQRDVYPVLIELSLELDRWDDLELACRGLLGAYPWKETGETLLLQTALEIERKGKIRQAKFLYEFLKHHAKNNSLIVREVEWRLRLLPPD